MEKHKQYTIIVNGTAHQWSHDEITYQQVVDLAYAGSVPGGDGVVFTVTFMKGHSDNEGFLSPNSKPLRVKEGMEFRVKHSTRS